MTSRVELKLVPGPGEINIPLGFFLQKPIIQAISWFSPIDHLLSEIMIKTNHMLKTRSMNPISGFRVKTPYRTKWMGYIIYEWVTPSNGILNHLLVAKKNNCQRNLLITT